MGEEETKKVNTESVTTETPAPAAPVPEPEVPVVEAGKDVTEEKSVVTEERSIEEEEPKPVVAPETKKSGGFFGLWYKSKKKDAAVKTETQEPAAVVEPAAVPEPEPETPVVEAPKEGIEEKLVVPAATGTEEKLEDTTPPATADAKKSSHFIKLPHLPWKKSPKKAETVEETPAVPEIEPELPVVEEEKSVIVLASEEKTEDPKPDADAAKKSGSFLKLSSHLPWNKSPKKPETVETPTVAETEPELPVVVEEKTEDPKPDADAPKKSGSSFLKLNSHLPWNKSPKKTETIETPTVAETEPELPVVVEEKSVIVPESEEKTQDPKPDADATKKSGGFLKLSSIKWPKTKKKESLESLPSVPVEESEATIAESLNVEVDEKSIVAVEENKADDESKPVVADDEKKVSKFFNIGSLSWKKTHTKETSEETVEEKKTDEGSNRDIVLSKAANEKTLTLIQAWEASEKAKAENKAEKKLSIIVSAENSKKAAAEAELRKIEEKLDTIKAENIEKLKNKEALIHKVAEEKRAAVEAKRAEELLIAEETAAKYRATGSAPKKLLL